MTNSNSCKNLANGAITRRSLMAGAAAVAGIAAVPGQAMASLLGAGTSAAGRIVREPTLARFLCSEVHGKIASRLDDIIADPAVDGEQTALALMEAYCPGCRQRVHPATSSISAVIPQWQWKGGNPVA